MQALLHSGPPNLQWATADPRLCQRLLDTCGQVWVSLLWGHCSFLLGPGVHKILFVPSKSLFPQSCVSSGSSVVGLMATSFKRAYAIPRSTAPRAPAPAAVHCWPVPLQETLKHSFCSVCVGFLGPGAHKVYLFRASQAWMGLILNATLPLLPSFWGFSFALGIRVSFFGGIKHSPVDDCSAASCNFGVLAEDEYTSFYSTILEKSDWLYSLQPKMEKLYTVSKTKLGADCGSDHELLIAKFTLKLKKVRETTRPFRYELNHIPYDYTVEVTNRFRGLDLIYRVPEGLWKKVHDIVQEAMIKTIPKKN